MSFDAITNADVNSLKSPLGSMMLVPTAFTSSEYVDAGSSFSATTYPKLAELFPEMANPGAVNEVAVPTFDHHAITAVYGNVVDGFTYNGEYYVVTANTLFAYLFGTTGGDLTKFKYIRKFPPSTNANTTISTNGVSVAATGRVYVSYIQTLHTMTFAEAVDPSFNTWTVATTQTTGATWTIFGANGLYIGYRKNAAASSNVLQYSTDGVTFTNVTGAFTSTYAAQDMAYGNGLFVIVTSGTSTNNIATSPDGITWTARSVGTVGHRAVTYYGVFVAVPNATTATAFYTSPDGITWTSRTITNGSPTTSSILQYVVGCASGFIAVSPVGSWAAATTLFVQTSADGITWTNKNAVNPFSTSTGGNPNANLRPLVFDNTLVVFGTSAANGSTPSLRYSMSTDLFATYTQYGMYGPDTSAARAPAWASSTHGIAIETSNSDSRFRFSTSTISALRTTDGGSTWEPMLINLNNTNVQIMDFFAIDGRYVLSGYYNTNIATIAGAFMFVSNDGGDTWTRSTGSYRVTRDGNGTLYRAADETTSGVTYSLSRSKDYGASWTPAGSFSVASGNAVALTRGMRLGAIVFDLTNNVARITQEDSLSFYGTTPFPVAVTTSTMTIESAWDANRTAIVVGGSNIISITYDDGASWSGYTLPAQMPSNVQIAMVDGWIIICTNSNYIYRSRDGKAWDHVQVTSGLPAGLNMSTNGATGYFGGINMATTGKFLATKTDYLIPPIVSSVSGAKWVVKAKK